MLLRAEHNFSAFSHEKVLKNYVVLDLHWKVSLVLSEPWKLIDYERAPQTAFLDHFPKPTPAIVTGSLKEAIALLYQSF